jgi:hypothetical protein
MLTVEQPRYALHPCGRRAKVVLVSVLYLDNLFFSVGRRKLDRGNSRLNARIGPKSNTPN